MEDYITRREHDEYARRMDEEHKRQNHRISAIEEGLKETSSIAMSVQKLAINMEQMIEEQKAQGKRLETLESRDGQMWRKVSGHMLTTAIGIIVGFVLKEIGIF